tara:strand:+ start:822 stop:1142 length:321 start_codon:yes stop_codon:yes gene_type:complete
MTIKNSTDETFNQLVKENKLVLADFWASWCSPCKALSPILEQIDSELKDKILILKHNIDEEPNVPTDKAVRGIPTLLLFKDGELVETQVGLSNKTNLLEVINKHIS